MKVTLAMGLQYDTTKHSPPQREDFSARLKPTENIIDVEPIKSKASTTLSLLKATKTFDYLTYNINAGLVLTPQVGTQLSISI
ncbi:MAG: hypothetical protein R8M46_06290 [Ghiorsea sp.]